MPTMSFLATTSPPTPTNEPAIENDPWFPEIDLGALRSACRLDGTVTVAAGDMPQLECGQFPVDAQHGRSGRPLQRAGAALPPRGVQRGAGRAGGGIPRHGHHRQGRQERRRHGAPRRHAPPQHALGPERSAGPATHHRRADLMATTLQVMTRDGDTVDQLCWRHLGRTAGVTEATLAANPGLAALGPRLSAGTLVDLVVVATPTQETVSLWD